MAKVALCIGIDHYDWAPLTGCVADAKSMSEVLSRNGDDENDPNFACITLTSDKHKLNKSTIRKEMVSFFKREAEMAFFFFAGHGMEYEGEGYLMGLDSEKHDAGIAFSDVVGQAVKSKIKDIFIVLDCCQAGIATGDRFTHTSVSRPGITILTASLEDQYCGERKGRGIFSSIIEMGLKGNAADILGNVTAAGLYNYADQMLGPLSQRPMFKTHVSGFKVLRKCKPKISKSILRMLTVYFPTDDFQLWLDKSFEPTEEPRDKINEAKFADLQVCVQAGLVEPVGVKHMYDAAMNEKSCRLTNAGKAYWSIVQKGLL